MNKSMKSQLPYYQPVRTSEDGAPAAAPAASAGRSTNLRWSVFVMLLVFAVIIMIGISQRSGDMDKYERYYDSTVIDDVSSIQERMGPVVQGLSDIKAQELKKQKGKRKKKKNQNDDDMPDPTDLTNTKSVWEFLFDNTDDSLILYTGSESEEASLNENNLNIITLLIKKVEKERADEWLVQLALWFHEVAVHWPKDIYLDTEAVQAIEGLLTSDDFEAAPELSDDAVKEIVAQGEISVDDSADNVGSTSVNETKHVDHVENTVKALLDGGHIAGSVAVAKLGEAVEERLSIMQWRKLLFFCVSVSEAAPMFEDYLAEWKETSFHKVEDIVFESSPIKKAEQMQVSAKLLTILERGCEDFPRTSKLIRATFLKVLDDEDKAEKEAKAKEAAKHKEG